MQYIYIYYNFAIFPLILTVFDLSPFSNTSRILDFFFPPFERTGNIALR